MFSLFLLFSAFRCAHQIGFLFLVRPQWFLLLLILEVLGHLWPGSALLLRGSWL